jgi:hypothetical protein
MYHPDKTTRMGVVPQADDHVNVTRCIDLEL